MLTIHGYMVVFFKKILEFLLKHLDVTLLCCSTPNNDEALQKSFCKSKNRKKHIWPILIIPFTPITLFTPFLE